MSFTMNFRKFLVVVLAGIALTACATQKKAAKESKCFNKILVSSDGDKILNLAKKYGVSAIKRSKKLSNDHVSVHDVIQNVILELKKKGENYKYVCYILPTAALIKSKDIIKSFALTFSKS